MLHVMKLHMYLSNSNQLLLVPDYTYLVYHLYQGRSDANLNFLPRSIE